MDTSQFPRLYIPKGNEMLFHYCSADAFQSICKNRTLRFSSIDAMNDSMELKWGLQKLHEVLLEWKEKQGPSVQLDDFIQTLERHLDSLVTTFHKLAICFSLEGDVLSQWRAYADDGKGFSLGFEPFNFGDVTKGAALRKIVYDENDQHEELLNRINILFGDFINAEQRSVENNMWLDCAVLDSDLAAFKNPAFSEEQEVRALLQLKVNNRETRRFLGTDVWTRNLEINFLMRNNVPVPYIDVFFRNNDEGSALSKVLLGPKNPATVEQIEIYLETIGIVGVEVIKSIASYR